MVETKLVLKGLIPGTLGRKKADNYIEVFVPEAVLPNIFSYCLCHVPLSVPDA